MAKGIYMLGYRRWLCRAKILGIGMALLVLGGCPPLKPPVPLPPPVTLDQTLEEVNANVAAIGPFRATVGQWELEVVTPEDQTKHFKELGGRFFYRPTEPGRSPYLYLQCSAPLQEAFVVGSNPTEYWFYSRWDQAKLAGWGKYQNVGKECGGKIWLDPRILLEFAGLSALPTAPRPSYKVYPETSIIEFEVATPSGSVSRREVILDRRTQLPVEVNAYDPNGVRIMHSELKDYQTLGSANVAMDIYFSWPTQKAFLRLKLSGLKPDPKDRTALFTRPKAISGVEDYHQLDADCGE